MGDAEDGEGPSMSIEWSWETVENEFIKGTDMSAVQQQDLHRSYNESQPTRTGEITLEDVQEWTGGNCETNFWAQRVELSTHTNVHTRDILRIWSYGMGGNSFGTIHFLLADGTAYKIGHITDGDLNVKKNVKLPESASEDTRKVLAGVLKWYKAIEYPPYQVDELMEIALGARSWSMAPSCDPDTWIGLAVQKPDWGHLAEFLNQ